jgi:hypothetical protein
MSSFVHARSFTVFPAIYVLPAANFADESAATLIRKTRLAFKMTIVDIRAADARLGSNAQDRMRFDHVRKSPIASARRQGAIDVVGHEQT